MEEGYHPESIHREEGPVFRAGTVFPSTPSTMGTGPSFVMTSPIDVSPPRAFTDQYLKPASSDIPSTMQAGPVLAMVHPDDVPPPQSFSEENWRYWDQKGPHHHEANHGSDPSSTHNNSSSPAVSDPSIAPSTDVVLDPKEIPKTAPQVLNDHTAITVSSQSSGQVQETEISEGNSAAASLPMIQETRPVPESVELAKIEPPTLPTVESLTAPGPQTDFSPPASPSETNPIQVSSSSTTTLPSETKSVESSSDLSKQSKKGFIASLTDNFKPETKQAWSQMFGYRYEDDVAADQKSSKTNQKLTVVQENELLMSSRKAKLQMEKRLDQQIQEYQRKFQERTFRKQQQEHEQTSRSLLPGANKTKIKSKFVLPSPIETFYSPSGLRRCIERATKQTCKCLQQMWSISTGEQVPEYQLEHEGIYVTKQELEALIHELFSVKSSRPQPLSLFANQTSTVKPSKLEVLLSESCFIPFGDLTQLRNIVAFGTKIHLNEQKLMVLHTALQRQLHLLPHSETLQSFFIADSYLHWDLGYILAFFRMIYVQLSRTKLEPPYLHRATEIFQLSPFDLTSKLQLTSLMVVQRILFFRFLLENLVKEKANPTARISSVYTKSKTSFSHRDEKDNDEGQEDDEDEDEEEEESSPKKRGRRRGKRSVSKTKQLKKKAETSITAATTTEVVAEQKEEISTKPTPAVVVEVQPTPVTAAPVIATQSTTTLSEEEKLKREKAIKSMQALKQRLESTMKRCDAAAEARISALAQGGGSYSLENNSTWALQQVAISTNTLAASTFCDSLDKAIHDQVEVDSKIVAKIEKFILSLQTLTMGLHKAATEQFSPPPSYDIINKSETICKPTTTIYKLDTSDTTPAISSSVARPTSSSTPRKIPTKLTVSTIEVPLTASQENGPKGSSVSNSNQISTIEINGTTPSGGDYEIGKSDALRFRKGPAFSFGSPAKSTTKGQVPPKSPFKSPRTPVRKPSLNTNTPSIGEGVRVATASPRKNQATSTTEPSAILRGINRRYENDKDVDVFLQESSDENFLINEDPEQEDEDAEVRQALQDQKRVFMGEMLNDLLCPRPPSATTVRRSSFEVKKDTTNRPSSTKNRSSSTAINTRGRPLKPRLVSSGVSSTTSAPNGKKKIDWNRQLDELDEEELDAEIFAEDTDKIQPKTKEPRVPNLPQSEIVEDPKQKPQQPLSSSSSSDPQETNEPIQEANDEHLVWAQRISEMYKTKLSSKY